MICVSISALVTCIFLVQKFCLPKLGGLVDVLLIMLECLCYRNHKERCRWPNKQVTESFLSERVSRICMISFLSFLVCLDIEVTGCITYFEAWILKPCLSFLVANKLRKLWK